MKKNKYKYCIAHKASIKHQKVNLFLKNPPQNITNLSTAHKQILMN